MSMERPAGELDDAGALRTGGVGAAEHGEDATHGGGGVGRRGETKVVSNGLLEV